MGQNWDSCRLAVTFQQSRTVAQDRRACAVLHSSSQTSSSEPGKGFIQRSFNGSNSALRTAGLLAIIVVVMMMMMMMMVVTMVAVPRSSNRARDTADDAASHSTNHAANRRANRTGRAPPHGGAVPAPFHNALSLGGERHRKNGNKASGYEHSGFHWHTLCFMKLTNDILVITTMRAL